MHDRVEKYTFAPYALLYLYRCWCCEVFRLKTILPHAFQACKGHRLAGALRQAIPPSSPELLGVGVLEGNPEESAQLSSKMEGSSKFGIFGGYELQERGR